MKHLVLLALLLTVIAAPAYAQDTDDNALRAEIASTLLALGDLDRYTVTWEIGITEWIAFWDADELLSGIDRTITLTYTDHYQAGDEHFTFQRLITATEERRHEDATVTYEAEIRIVDGVIYVWVEVLDGEMSGAYPLVWTEWRYPDQILALEDLQPHTYFAAVEMDSPLPLFDLSPESIEALTTGITTIDESFWPWRDVSRARQAQFYGTGPSMMLLIATRPSLDTGDPFVHALMDYAGDESSELFRLYFDREQPGTLIGIEDYRTIEAENLPRNAFLDGAPDSQWLYVNTMRVSTIEFRDLDADFDPITAPPVQ